MTPKKIPPRPVPHPSTPCTNNLPVPSPSTPTHIKARAKTKRQHAVSEGSHTKKEHMKEAQSPKNVESGENLYRCDPRTDHQVDKRMFTCKGRHRYLR